MLVGMKSGNHSAARQQPDGSWFCGACASESFDFELFEEAGDQNSCMGPQGSAERMALQADVARAQKHIEDATAGLDRYRDSLIISESVVETMTRSLKKMARDYEVMMESKEAKWTHWQKRYLRLPATWPSAETGTETSDGPSPSLTTSQERALRKSSTPGTSASGPEPKASATSEMFANAWNEINRRSGSYPATTTTTRRSRIPKTLPGVRNVKY